MIFILNPLGRLGYPARNRLRRTLRRRDARRRSPKGGKWKFPQALLDFGTHRQGSSINVEDLAAIGWIARPWSNRIIRAGIHVIPPEQLGAGEARFQGAQFLPDFSALHQAIGLLPKMDLSEVPVIPAIGHNPVPRRWQASQVSGLRRTGQRGKNRNNRALFSFLRKPVQPGRRRPQQRLS